MRVWVVGNSGAGKTTFARRLAERLGVPRLELDSIYHQPNWTPLPDDEYRRRVESFTRSDAWVVDGNYSRVADLVYPRAQTVVWLDPPRRTVMRRVIGRTLRRLLTRELLWNGNREPLSNVYRLDPEKNIMVWAWTRHRVVRERYERMSRDGTWSHLQVLRVRTDAEAEAILDRFRP
jgi:adenylate kinase family enzyme